MKTSVSFITIVMSLISLCTYAQVAVNEDNSNPDPSAMLDVKATDKILIKILKGLEENKIELQSGIYRKKSIFDINK